MELSKLKRQRATDEVYEALRQAILSHVFKAGARLQVNEIADKLGVSMTPVRHAIQQLSTEGLIEIRPRSGTFVASLSVEDLEESFEVRCALECLAAERAVERVTPAVVHRLKELLGILSAPVDDDAGRERHEKANAELHGVLIQTSGNKRLAEIYDSLNAHIKIALVHRSETNWNARLAEERAEHQEIVDSLEHKDGVRLVAALRKHIHRAKDDLVASLRSAADE